MSRRKLFNGNESNPDLGLNQTMQRSPNRGGVHPALLNSSTPIPGSKKKNKCTKDDVPREAIQKSKSDSGTKAQETDSDIDIESDDMEIPSFFANSNQKLPYSREEDEMILRYVLQGQNIFKVSSILLWKHLEGKKENPKRTYQSLKNRFLRNIKPCLFTTFAHFIKDKATTSRILAKFPELKHSMGRTKVLSKIKLPERKPLPKAIEEDRVSSTSTNESQGNEKVTSLPSECPVPNDACTSVILEPESFAELKSKSNSTKYVIYERIVRAENDEISICVNFKSKKYVETPSIGIYNTYEKLKRKNKYAFCPTCGRYSIPKNPKSFKGNSQTNYIPNSVDSTSRSSKKPNLDSNLNNNITPKQTSSEFLKQNQCSPSLLTPSDVTEAEEIDKQPSFEGKGRLRTYSNKKKSQLRTPLTAGEKVSSSEGGSKRVPVPTASTSKSDKEPNSGTSKRKRDLDEDLESICEDAMANFRKLIDHEEEQQLVRKCLNKNFKSIGLEEVSQSNWDSYFLESSSDMETPPLTIDYETDSENNRTEGQSESANNSALAKNMKKMLSEKKKKS